MYKNYPVFFLHPGLGIILAVLLIWSVIWKGMALWKAAQNKHLGWFVVLFLVNTVGILDIIYIYGISKKQQPVNRI